MRPVVVPLADAFRDHWRTAAWLALAASSAIATLSPALSLSVAGSPVLRPDPIRAAELLLPLSSSAQSPAALQSDAIAQLLALLVVIASSACAVAVVTALTIQWTRSGARQLDTAVRRAMGASRRGLALSFLGEGMVIALTAIPLGVTSGFLALRLALRRWPDAVGAWHYSPTTVAAAAALVLLLGALLPLRYARGKRLVNLPANPLSLFPPVVQIGASLAILLAAAMVSRQATLLIGAGNSAADGTVYQLVAEDSDPAARSARYVDMLRDLAGVEGVEGVSLTSPGALLGLGTVDWVETDCGQCFTGGMFVRFQDERAAHHAVSPDTFAVFGIPVVAGRAFTLEDSWTAPRVAIVNRQMAARHFENGNPLGRTIFMGTARVPYTVVGVVDDAGAPGRSGGVQPRFAVYLSSLQHPVAAADLLVRGTALTPANVERIIARQAGIQHTRGTSEWAIRRAFSLPMAWFARWFRIEAIAALLLGALGVMVSVALWASALVPELAVHRALGATRRRITAAVLGRTVLITAAGIFVALTAVGPSLRAVLAEILGDLPLLPAGEIVLPALFLSIAAMIGALRPLARAVRTPPAALLDS
jgi:putative ABC transport system permease protein